MKGWGGGWPEKDDVGAAAGPGRGGRQETLGRTSLNDKTIAGEIFAYKQMVGSPL